MPADPPGGLGVEEFADRIDSVSSGDGYDIFGGVDAKRATYAGREGFEKGAAVAADF